MSFSFDRPGPSITTSSRSSSCLGLGKPHACASGSRCLNGVDTHWEGCYRPAGLTFGKALFPIEYARHEELASPRQFPPGLERRQPLTRRSALRLLAGGASLAISACASAATNPSGAGTLVPTAAPSSPDVTSSGKPTAAVSSAAANSGRESGSAANSGSAGAPKAGGRLRFAQSVDLDASGVEGARLGPAYTPTVYMIWDTLTAYDSQRNPTPMLAESWEQATDGKSIKLNLRKGVTFHSGREFTSDDVKYNLLRVRDPKVGTGQLVGMSNWFTIDTPDKDTVVLKSDVPRPTVFDMFEYFNIVDRELADGPDSKTRSGGTGPFSLIEWVAGDHISFAKNANYWQAASPTSTVSTSRSPKTRRPWTSSSTPGRSTP